MGISLEEAEVKFSNDPLVCLAVIQGDVNPWTQDWIDKLIAAEPTNSEGFYLKAWMSGTQGDRPAAIEALRQAAAMKDWPNDRRQERMLTAQEAAVACGVGVGDSVRLTLTGPLQHSITYQILESITNVLSEELTEAKASGSEEHQKVIARIGLDTAAAYSQAISLAPPATIEDELRAIDLQKAMLRELPEDFEIGGERPSTLIQWAEDRRIYIATSIEIDEQGGIGAIFETASDEDMYSYLANYLASGELKAQEWLQMQAKEAKRRADADGGK